MEKKHQKPHRWDPHQINLASWPPWASNTQNHYPRRNKVCHLHPRHSKDSFSTSEKANQTSHCGELRNNHRPLRPASLDLPMLLPTKRCPTSTSLSFPDRRGSSSCASFALPPDKKPLALLYSAGSWPAPRQTIFCSMFCSHNTASAR